MASKFIEVECTPAEFEVIIQKSVLTHTDLQKFASYYGTHDVDFDIVSTINKRVIQNNDIEGWNILSEAEYYYGFHPAFDICLQFATECGDAPMFLHILQAYTTYAKLEYGEPIPFEHLRHLAHQNPHVEMRDLINHLSAILQSDVLTEEFAEQHKTQILEEFFSIPIKEPEFICL
jgi:hypothetical protein